MDEVSLAELGMGCVERLFRTAGSLLSPILLLEENGLVRVMYLELPEETKPDELHQAVLKTLESTIRESKTSEIFVGYEAFVLREESAVRVLVAACYSDEREQFWIVQIHGNEFGDWRELSGDRPLFGFDGLWSRAKSYLRN